MKHPDSKLQILWNNPRLYFPRNVIKALLKPKTAVLICFVLLVSGMTLRLAEVHFIGRNAVPGSVTYYGSDDTAQANILYARQHGASGPAVTGPDSWFLKFPVYFVTNNLPVNPNIKLFINAWVPLITGSILLLWAYVIFSRSLKMNLRRFSLSLYTITASLIAMPAIAFITFCSANSRNIELGVVTLASAYLFRFELMNKSMRNVRWSTYALLIFIVGLTCADDPYFLYVFIAPLIFTLILLLLKGVSITKLAYASGVAVLSGIAGVAIRKIVTTLFSLGTVNQPSLTTSADGFLANWRSLLNYTPNLFGIYPWSRPYGAHGNLLSLLYAITLILSVTGIIWAYKRRGNANYIYTILLITFVIASPVILSITTLINPQDLLMTRYMILCVPMVLFGIPLFYKFVSKRRQIALFVSSTLTLSVLILGQSTIHVLANVGKNNTNRDYLSMVDAIEKQGVMKGYGNYQYANIGTYLSEHKLTILPTICTPGSELNTLKFYDILVQSSLMEKSAKNSFYLYATNDPNNCTPKYLESQFGKPSKVVPVLRSDQESVNMAVYDYDITKKLDIQKAGV